MDKIPPPPQQVAVLGSEGKLSLPWNLWLTEFIKTLQNVGDGLDALGLYGSGSGGGVASSGAGSAVDLIQAFSGQGVSNLGARADHQHQRSILSALASTDIASVQTLNFLAPGLDVTAEPDMAGDVFADRVAGWTLTEASGTRYDNVGTAHLTDPTAVGSIAAPLGLAAQFVKASSQYLTVASPSIIPFITGDFTMALRFYLDGTQATTSTLVACGNANVTVDIPVAGSRHFVRWYYATPNTNESTSIPITINAWHSVVCWWDGTNLGIQVDDQPAKTNLPQYVTRSTSNSAMYVGALTSALRFSDSRVQHLNVWDRVLTADERLRVIASARANVGINWAALELFGG